MLGGGCSEGPSTSHATICAHVCMYHLGVRLACPTCTKTFLNLDALMHHKRVTVISNFNSEIFFHSNCYCNCYYFFSNNVEGCFMCFLCVRPVEVLGSLSLCVVYVKGHFMHLFVCKTCRNTRKLVFCVLTEFVNSEALRKKLTCYFLVKGKAMCLNDHLLITFPWY